MKYLNQAIRPYIWKENFEFKIIPRSLGFSTESGREIQNIVRITIGFGKFITSKTRLVIKDESEIAYIDHSFQTNIKSKKDSTLSLRLQSLV